MNNAKTRIIDQVINDQINHYLAEADKSRKNHDDWAYLYQDFADSLAKQRVSTISGAIFLPFPIFEELAEHWRYN